MSTHDETPRTNRTVESALATGWTQIPICIVEESRNIEKENAALREANRELVCAVEAYFVVYPQAERSTQLQVSLAKSKALAK